MRRFFLWQTPELERLLDRESAAGRQLCSGALCARRYRPADGACWHRVGVCEARPGSASEAEYRLRQQRAGWEFVCRQGPCLVFRRAAGTGEKPALADGGAGLRDLLHRRCRGAETGRLCCFVLAALLLIAGYAADRFWIIRTAAVPLAAALGLTYLIRALERGEKAG